MRFIQKWSYSCANHLVRQLNEGHEKRGVYYYGFQILIGSIVKGVMLVLLSLLLGILVPTLTVMAFFVSLRVIAGGFHMDTYGKCIATSMGIFLLAGLIVQYTNQYWTPALIMAFTATVFLIGLYAVKKWIPSDTPNRPITKPEEIKKFKVLSTIHIFIWILLMGTLIYFKQYMFTLAGCFGVLIAEFIVSPAGYKFFGFISGMVDKISRKRKSVKA